MPRPLIRSSLADLEAAFDREHANPQFLSVLIDELAHRSTHRAARLRARAEAALQATTESVTERPPTITPSASEASTRADAEVSNEPPKSRALSAQPPTPRSPPSPEPMPPITNAPVDVLAAWTALEALSPQSFRRPEDLSGGDKRAVAPIDGPRLPWEGGGQVARPGTRLYYQILLGTVDLEIAVKELQAIYADTRAEKPSARGHAVLAVITVDRDGRPVEGGVAISSFGWALPRALNRQLRSLGDWRSVERALTDRFDLYPSRT